MHRSLFLQSMEEFLKVFHRFHLSEECSNSQKSTPRAIMLTATVGAIGGWILCIVVAYTVRILLLRLTFAKLCFIGR